MISVLYLFQLAAKATFLIFRFLNLIFIIYFISALLCLLETIWIGLVLVNNHNTILCWAKYTQIITHIQILNYDYELVYC